MKITTNLIFLFFLSFFLSCTTNKQIDLIVYNAKVYTVDSVFSTVEAIAVNNGVIVEIGDSQDLLNKYDAKEKVDVNGKFIYPGFYDAHAHFFMLAEAMDEVDLVGSLSYNEVLERLKTYVAHNPDKKWIVGNGWDQNLWEDKNFPTKDSLDKYFPDLPIYLTRIDYHAAVVNSKALEKAHLDSAYFVEGGVISVNAEGLPDGILIDNAMQLVRNHIPKNQSSALLKILRRAQDSLLSVGLTSIVDAGLTPDQIESLKIFYNEDSLAIRDYAMVTATDESIRDYLRAGTFESDRLTVRSFKLMADGALGSRGACLLHPYNDAPTNGFLLQDPEEFDRIIKRLANSNFQVNTHAIGDSANRIILDTYGKYLKDGKKRRWRIEHAQIIAPSDFDKFKQFQIIPSVQPTHATSDMYWAEDRIGADRIKGAYAYKKLLDEYGLLALGSDFPVEHYNPLYGFHAAVARVDKNGFPDGGFQMENAITREQALRGMTIWAAYSCFQDKKRGSIEKGKDADFVILEEDIMKAPNEELRDIKTLRTVIAGKTEFLRK
ncbi:amidohydrolase [Sphingobacterium daejeonense]|uniref:amidohydrolase n=1 Tax=Sphingobacterium daejeonense TaxID=371142 RepID=UPI0010C33E74|nr:amidohydrolase [Sphingobacterium daejeonense]VTQ05682.1 N-substituted formamide deformylase precursor [Sphingobacterium daejeonense]